MSDDKKILDDFAKAALTGLLANPDTEKRLEAYARTKDVTYLALLSEVCYKIAKEMIHERSHRK